MVGHGGSSAGSYLADPTSPIPSHCASIIVTSTLRVNILTIHITQKAKRNVSTLFPVVTESINVAAILKVTSQIYKVYICEYIFPFQL